MNFYKLLCFLLIFALTHGALSGGIGAVLAEKTAEFLTSPPDLSSPHPNLSSPRRRGSSLVTPETNAELGKLVAVTATALIPKLDPDIAHHTGTTAVEHNFLKHFQPKTIKEVEQSLEGSQKVWDVVNPKLPGAAQAREELPENLLIDLVFPERLWDLAPGFTLISKPIKAASVVVKAAPKVVTKALPKATFTTTVPKMVPKKIAPLPRPTTTAPTPKPKVTANPSQGPPTKKQLKDQPWTIRPGQEYKEKIVGTGQKTGTPGHNIASKRKALEAAKRDEVEIVTMDRGLNRFLPEGQKLEINRRPDIAYKTTDGKIHQIEVPSKTDKIPDLRQRMDETKMNLPEEIRGKTDIELIKKAIDELKK